MINQIWGYGRSGQSDLVVKRDNELAERTGSATGAVHGSESTTSTVPPQRIADDELVLSKAAKEASGEREVFDTAKVEAIKRAITEGNYPLDSRRIAESFHALERLL